MGNSADFKHDRNRRNTKNRENINSNNLFDLDLDGNLLLPIMFIFLLGKSDLDFPILDNIKTVAKDLIDIPLNMDFSTEDIQVMIQAVNSVSPYMNSDNMFILDTFSDFLSAMHKISTVKEFKSDMTRGSSDNPRKPLKFKNQKQKALHMIGALEQFMDDSTRKNMANFKNALDVLDKMEETNKGLSQKRKNGKSLDMNDMMQFIKPLLGNASLPDAQKIDSMIRMVQIMSALDESDIPDDIPNDIPNNFEANNDFDGDDDDDGSFFEFVIDKYDDEDDE